MARIMVLSPKVEFSLQQRQRLAKLGKANYPRTREEYSVSELADMAKGAEVVAFDPDNIGGFEKAPKRLVELMTKLPNLKGLALSTTAYGYVDLEYCRKRGITVTNVPYYSTESVAEHVLAFLLGASKRVFLSDRRTQKGEYRLEQGFELKGKILGVIGLGNIGTRVAELGQAIGMKVIAWNRTPKQVNGVILKSLAELVSQTDAISLNLAENEETKGLISEDLIKKMKKGIIVINTADRSLVNEQAMANVLKSGQVDSYVLEAKDLTSPPLGDLENAYLFKGFGWFTKEALERNKEIWVNNIEGLLKGQPLNPVN